MPTSSQASLTEAEIVQMELEDLTNLYFQVLFLHVAMFFTSAPRHRRLVEGLRSKATACKTWLEPVILSTLQKHCDRPKSIWSYGDCFLP